MKWFQGINVKAVQLTQVISPKRRGSVLQATHRLKRRGSVWPWMSNESMRCSSGSVPIGKIRGLLWCPSEVDLNSNSLNGLLFHICHTRLPWQDANGLPNLRLLKHNYPWNSRVQEYGFISRSNTCGCPHRCWGLLSFWEFSLGKKKNRKDKTTKEFVFKSKRVSQKESRSCYFLAWCCAVCEVWWWGSELHVQNEHLK